MNILIIGDVVGSPGRAIMKRALPQVVRKHDVDYVIANVENAAGGFGVTPDICQEFLAMGVDVMTSGNHIWDKREIIPVMGQYPQLLRPGGTVELPLALPRRVDTWSFEIVAEEPVTTPFGAVEAFHLKPRRLSRPGGELSAEMWFAPRLRYLPVRIRIQQDAETFIDLVIARRPELGAAERP